MSWEILSEIEEIFLARLQRSRALWCRESAKFILWVLLPPAFEAKYAKIVFAKSKNCSSRQRKIFSLILFDHNYHHHHQRGAGGKSLKVEWGGDGGVGRDLHPGNAIFVVCELWAGFRALFNDGGPIGLSNLGWIYSLLARRKSAIAAVELSVLLSVYKLKRK